MASTNDATPGGLPPVNVVAESILLEAMQRPATLDASIRAYHERHGVPRRLLHALTASLDGERGGS